MYPLTALLISVLMFAVGTISCNSEPTSPSGQKKESSVPPSAGGDSVVDPVPDGRLPAPSPAPLPGDGGQGQVPGGNLPGGGPVLPDGNLPGQGGPAPAPPWPGNKPPDLPAGDDDAVDVPADDTTTTPPDQGAPPAAAGDVCQEGGPDYSSKGPYTFKRQALKGGFSIYLPDSTGCKNPPIAFAMGTGTPSITYTRFYEGLASYGFAVIVDPNMMAGSGTSLMRSLDAAYAEHGTRLADAAGTTGHSQGGYGAIQASKHKNVKAIVGLMSGQFAMTGNFNLPFLGISASADMFGPFTDEASNHYKKFKGPKFRGKQVGATHMSFSGAKGQNNLTVTTAWFRCWLSGDQDGCAMFDGNTCDQFPGDWTDCAGADLP